jgi:hypothetical protein
MHVIATAVVVDGATLHNMTWNEDIVVASLFSGSEAAGALSSAWNGTGTKWCSPY